MNTKRVKKAALFIMHITPKHRVFQQVPTFCYILLSESFTNVKYIFCLPMNPSTPSSPMCPHSTDSLIMVPPFYGCSCLLLDQGDHNLISIASVFAPK